MASNHVRRAVILALLERSAEARQALDKAIKYFSYADSVLSQLEISPDIQLATGRTALYASPDAQRVALHYLRALFSAYVGASDFASELAGADEAARVVMPSIREDAYVMALNWGWLQEKKKKEGRPDYGAEVGEGALWERLGFPEWAACYYQTFEDQHHKLHDNRYDQLAKWANQRLAGLGHREPHVCGRLRTLPSDPRALELEARESSNQKYYEKAQADINKAIEKQPNNIELLLLRADIRMNLAIKANQAIVAANAEINKAQDELNKVKKGSSAESGLSGAASREAKPMSPAEVQAAKDKLRDTIIKDSTDAQQQEKNRTEAWEGIKADSETIIKLDPNTADAYFWRGVAYSWLRKPEEPFEPVLKDFRKALSLNVTHPGVLNELSNLPAQDKNARWAALGYAKDFNRFYPGYGFAREAKLHNQLKQFSFAVDAIEHAIAVDGTDLNNYDIRAESERGLGLDEQAVSRRLAEGYFQAGDILKQRGNTEQAYAAFEKAWVVLGKTQGSASQTKMRCNSNVTVCEKTEVIHSYGAAVVSVITEVQAGEGMVRIVKVNRGSEDGLTMGAQGELFSSYGKADGNTRDLNQIGRAEVLGVDSHSAIVEIKMDKPSGDGLARPGDIVQVPGFLK
jgi:tetratricopeptide (TPR) repeat protein